jgi:hypothetical protein
MPGREVMLTRSSLVPGGQVVNKLTGDNYVASLEYQLDTLNYTNDERHSPDNKQRSATR